MSQPGSVPLQRLTTLCREHLGELVHVETYEYASCYLWHDRPLYNDYGEQILHLRGNTIYLYRDSSSPNTDLFHELGHFAGRVCNFVGHKENGYHGEWQQHNTRLIAQVTEQRHWSQYLNDFAGSLPEFKSNAASELWAELFMLYHLYPSQPEAQLIEQTMQRQADDPILLAVCGLAEALRVTPTR